MKNLLHAIATFLACAAHAQEWQNPRALADMALANNPTLIRLANETAAARERLAPASAQPNPMLMAGIQDMQVDLRADEMMTMVMVGAQQTLTRPARLNVRRAIVETEIRALEQQTESARAAVARDVLLAWYDVASADEQLRAIEQVREVIDAIVAAARVRYEVGSAAQSDVIRAQLQVNNLEHELLGLRAKRKLGLARLLPLLGMPMTAQVPPLALPKETEDLPELPGAIPPDDHPALAALRAEVERQEQEIELMRLEAKPDLGIEASYGLRRETDVFSVVATIELPLRKDRTVEPRVREAIARRDAAQQRVEELRRSLVQAMASAAAIHEEVTKQLELHHHVLVPQARLAFESTLASYQTGKSQLDAILMTESELLRLELDLIDFLARHAQSVATYEALQRGATGGAVTSAGTSSGSMQ